jgi:transcriptional regulator with XRE-family HTH domain
VRLREVREDAGLSQEALGFRAGLHRTEISLLERGDREPRLSTLIRLAAALDVGVSAIADDLLRWEAPSYDDGDFRPEGRWAPSSGTGLTAPALARTVHENVISLRGQRDWTQRELAERAGVPRPVLARIEVAGRPAPVEVIVSIARAFGVPPISLFKGVPAHKLPDDLPDLLAAAEADTEAGVFRRGKDSALAPDIRSVIARNLTSLREKAGLSQRKLGEKSGVSRIIIREVEHELKVPALQTVGRLAAALDVPPSGLIDP